MSSILIIDDSASMRHVIGQALLEAGHLIQNAATPEAALELVAKEKFGLLICDLNLPGMSGIELTTRLKGGESLNRFTPVLIVTTEFDEEKKAAGKAAGASAWLVKPFETATLLSAVSKLAR